MLDAPLYENEALRLKALLDLNVLDTPQEAILDEMTKVVSLVCQTPIALVSLIDNDRQWFKSKVGLNVNETPRNISFCGHAIHHKEVFIVEDARTDERFKDNPLVLEDPHIVFYAGAPLTTPLGYNIGTLCVVDQKPKQLNKEQISILNIFSKIIVSHMLSKQQNHTIRMLNEELQKSAFKINSVTENMVRSSKLASLVEMATGIAHEINNPLAIIQGRAYIILHMLNNNTFDIEKAKQYLEIICATSTRISKIVVGLRNFSRSTEQDPFYICPLQKIINESVELIQEKISHHKVKLQITCASNLELECRSTQIAQCIVNMLSNHIDALEKKENKWIKIEALEKEDIIEIKFTDSNNGIRDPEVLNRLFQPFFTTKPAGKGVGLGLSITKGLVESHKGEIFYNSQCENTQFIMRFPKKQNINKT